MLAWAVSPEQATLSQAWAMAVQAVARAPQPAASHRHLISGRADQPDARTTSPMPIYWSYWKAVGSMVVGQLEVGPQAVGQLAVGPLAVGLVRRVEVEVAIQRVAVCSIERHHPLELGWD